MSLIRRWRLCAFLALLGLSSLYDSVNCTRNAAVPDKPKGAFPQANNDKKPEPWAHKVFESLVSGVQRSAQQFLRYPGEGAEGKTLQIPLGIDVLLIGFDGTGGFGYKLDTVALQKFLYRSFPTYRPACQETGRELEVSVKLAYSVRHVDSTQVTAIELALHDNLKLVEDKNGHKVYDVEATQVEPILERIYQETFKNDKSAHEPYVLYVVNPDKRRVLDKTTPPPPPPPLETITKAAIDEQEAGFTYRYAYEGGGAAASWVGAGRFAVVDLAAGPCVYGRLGVSEGTVGPNALPRLGPLLAMYMQEATKMGPVAEDPKGHAAVSSARARHMIGALSTLVVSSVKHLFAPDIRAETLDFAQRVLMPVLVLRNHHVFNPLAPGHAHSIDVDHIRREAKSMVQDRQELVMVSGTHNLHEHERLSLAVARAVTSASKAVTGPDGAYSLQTHSILDSQVLLDEMHHAADMLASGLIGLQDPKLAQTFYNAAVPLDDKVDARPGGKRTRSQGTRVVPVYVISLAGMPSDLLLDGEALVAADRDLVVVLQLVTNATGLQDDGPAVPLRFLSEGRLARVRPQDPTRHVLSGVAMALAGISPPTERWSCLHASKKESYMWAVGAHPFGPFSNTSTMGAIFKDTAKRNDILSRTDAALRGVRAALQRVDAFAEQYMHRPFGDKVNVSADHESWLDRLYHDPNRKDAPLPHRIVEHMEKELKVLERLFVKLGNKLYNHNLKEANTLASSTLITTHTFADYVKNELETAAAGLRCCKLEHTMPQHSKAYTYASILIAGITVYWMVIYFSQPKQSTTYYQYGRY